jgi:FAD-dependent urate hydroxylase
MDVCVVGAGIGGLALAGGLVADGHQVRVLERRAEPSLGGAAVTIFSNGMAAAAGLGVDLSDLGGDIQRLRMRRASGRSLMSTDLRPLRRRTGFPVRTIARDELIGRLTAGLDADVVRYGSPVSSVRVDGERIHLTLSTGEQLAPDVLVGADGYRSIVRASVLDDGPASEVGWVTWQGLGTVLPDVAGGVVGELVVGPAGLVGMMPAGAGRTQWWFDTRWSRDDPEDTSPLTELRRRFGSYAEPVSQLLAAITDADLGRYPHVLHQLPAEWGRGAVTLLGDAAHAFPPSQAQGANQALEDAWLLRRALAGGGDLVSSLRGYERRRTARVRLVSRMAASERTNRAPSAVLGALARATPAGVTGRAYVSLIRRFSSVLNDDQPTGG